MATIGNTYLNLIDMMKGTEDGKTIATVIELLNLTNPCRPSGRGRAGH